MYIFENPYQNKIFHCTHVSTGERMREGGKKRQICSHLLIALLECAHTMLMGTVQEPIEKRTCTVW